MTSRIAFLGTPGAAVPTLEALADAHEIALVVTQPDRPRGRSSNPVAPPVKLAAERLGLRVSQPESSAQLHEALETAGPLDVGVVVAYGRILRPEHLAVPAHGFVNVHFSLLPRWRGAAPVNRALMAGDDTTGVTIIRLDEGLDTGPVLSSRSVEIDSEEDAGALTDRLAALGASTLTEALDPYLTGSLIPTPQGEEGVTYADKLTRSDRQVGVDLPTSRFIDHVRGLAPSPAAVLDIDGAPHKLLSVVEAASGPAPGRWATVDGRPVIGVSDGAIELVTLQPPGKTPQSGPDWLRGRHSSSGVVG
jgi:methionyl-tRNA formyltransferase